MEMGNITDVLRQCVVMSLFISVVRILLGQSELHKYFQFFAGLVLLLLFFTPVLKLLGNEDILLHLGFEEIREEYEQSRDFSDVWKDYGQMAESEATRSLVVGFGEALREEPYEIYEHEARYQDGKLSCLTLFLRLKKREGSVTKEQMKECLEKIEKNFAPDFTVRVKGEKCETRDF